LNKEDATFNWITNRYKRGLSGHPPSALVPDSPAKRAKERGYEQYLANKDLADRITQANQTESVSDNPQIDEEKGREILAEIWADIEARERGVKRRAKQRREEGERHEKGPRKDLFDFQVEALIAKGFAKPADADPFRNRLPEKGLFLFVPPPPRILDIDEAMSRLSLGDGRWHHRGDKSWLKPEAILDIGEYPRTASLLVEISDGHSYRDAASSSDHGAPRILWERFQREGRHPYNIWRGIIHVACMPWVLDQPAYTMLLLGTRGTDCVRYVPNENHWHFTKPSSSGLSCAQLWMPAYTDEDVLLMNENWESGYGNAPSAGHVIVPFDAGGYELTDTGGVPPWDAQPKPSPKTTLLPIEEPTPTTPRKIMGRNFLSIAEVEQHFGVTYSEEQLKSLAEIPFSEATLKECKDTHILVAGFPMTILDIRTKIYSKKMEICFVPRGVRYRLSENGGYSAQAFAATEKVGLRWYLIRKDIVNHSFSAETFNDAKRLLGPGDVVPRACELVYATLLYFMATGERLFGRWYVCCIDLDLDGHQIGIGNFDSRGIAISSFSDDDYGGGLSSARKPDQ